MMERLIASLMAFFMLALPSPAPAPSVSAPDVPVLRALLIGSDTFLTQENTYPIAYNNLSNLEQALAADSRTYLSISSYYDEIGHLSALESAVSAAFAGADDNDISLLYFSAHGAYRDENGQSTAGLYLSDGMEETLLSPEELYAVTSAIPGAKIILLDACNSGAFIGKGTATLSPSHPFVSPDHILLTSAGASEASWQWQGQGEFASGSSYFTDMLCTAISGAHPGDTNLDGRITVAEAYAFISLNAAASTAHCYPENCTADLFTYSQTQAGAAFIDDITFDETLLTAGQSQVHFSFTVRREAALYYQIVYYRSGAWDFENAQHFLDDETGAGTISPGRKQRSLVLDMPNGQDYGYVMLQFIALENDQPAFQGSRLITIQPQQGNPELTVSTADVFSPGAFQEMPVLIDHALPCGLSVTVKDRTGRTVRRLSYAQPTRPQQLSPAASLFWWDGSDNKGNPARPGEYYIHVQTTIGEEKFTAYSAPFVLKNSEAAAP